VLQCVSGQNNVTHLWHGPPYWRLVYNVQIYLLRMQCCSVSEQNSVTHLWHGPPYWRLVYNVQIYLLTMQCCSVFQSKVM
jgi:hypothetical protein